MTWWLSNWRRCADCGGELVRVGMALGPRRAHLVSKPMHKHRGHYLYPVRWIRLTEWVRILVGAL